MCRASNWTCILWSSGEQSAAHSQACRNVEGWKQWFYFDRPSDPAGIWSRSFWHNASDLLLIWFRSDSLQAVIDDFRPAMTLQISKRSHKHLCNSWLEIAVLMYMRGESNFLVCAWKKVHEACIASGSHGLFNYILCLSASSSPSDVVVVVEGPTCGTRLA